jgi:hypothetical protein
MDQRVQVVQVLKIHPPGAPGEVACAARQHFAGQAALADPAGADECQEAESVVAEQAVDLGQRPAPSNERRPCHRCGDIDLQRRCRSGDGSRRVQAFPNLGRWLDAQFIGEPFGVGPEQPVCGRQAAARQCIVDDDGDGRFVQRIDVQEALSQRNARSTFELGSQHFDGALLPGRQQSHTLVTQPFGRGAVADGLQSGQGLPDQQVHDVAVAAVQHGLLEGLDVAINGPAQCLVGNLQARRAAHLARLENDLAQVAPRFGVDVIGPQAARELLAFQPAATVKAEHGQQLIAPFGRKRSALPGAAQTRAGQQAEIGAVRRFHGGGHSAVSAGLALPRPSLILGMSDRDQTRKCLEPWWWRTGSTCSTSSAASTRCARVPATSCCTTSSGGGVGVFEGIDAVVAALETLRRLGTRVLTASGGRRQQGYL